MLPLALVKNLSNPPEIPTSGAPLTVQPQPVSPAVVAPGSNAPAETAPGPAVAVEPPDPTAAMLASAWPVPSATANHFRIRHFRFRASSVGVGRARGRPRHWLSSSVLTASFKSGLRISKFHRDPETGHIAGSVSRCLYRTFGPFPLLIPPSYSHITSSFCLLVSLTPLSVSYLGSLLPPPFMAPPFLHQNSWVFPGWPEVLFPSSGELPTPPPPPAPPSPCALWRDRRPLEGK